MKESMSTESPQELELEKEAGDAKEEDCVEAIVTRWLPMPQ